MKPSQLHIPLLAALSLAIGFAGHAQSNTANKLPDMSVSSGISRISKDSVEARLTAKDLIGTAVYDIAGEKIGDIADIDLHGSLPSATGASLNAKDAPAHSQDSSIEDSKGSTIYLSVGGLFGIGDDLVSFPASHLSYNSAKDHFQLATSKADVVALAEQHGTTQSSESGMSTTAAGKQSFTDEASRVKKALESDPMTSAFAQTIMVTTDGRSLELHGTVDNRDQQKKLVDAARRATSLDVKDKLDVR